MTLTNNSAATDIKVQLVNREVKAQRYHRQVDAMRAVRRGIRWLRSTRRGSAVDVPPTAIALKLRLGRVVQ